MFVSYRPSSRVERERPAHRPSPDGPLRGRKNQSMLDTSSEPVMDLCAGSNATAMIALFLLLQTHDSPTARIGGVQLVVFGAGAIGSLVGARLHQAGIDVTLVGRKAHVEAIAASGLLLKSAGGSQRVRLQTTTSLTGPADIILLTVKSQDVTRVCREIAQLNGDATVVTMQNGVRSDQEAAAILGRDRIIGCVLNVSASYLEPGVVEQ